MKRRYFLKLGAGSILATPYIISRQTPLFASPTASPIVSIFDNQASAMNFVAGKVLDDPDTIIDKVNAFNIDYPRVASMVDSAVINLTNKTSVAEAWESLFPEGHLSVKTKVGIKVNFSYGYGDEINNWNETCCPFGAKAAVTEAITTGLTQMLSGTFPVENITIYDLGHAIVPGRISPVIQGYRPVIADDNGIYKSSGQGMPEIHWINSRVKSEFPEDAPQFIAAPDFPAEYQAPQRIVPDVYENDFMINLAVAKDHRSAGITGVMKNTYGCTDNCVATHGDEWMNPDTPFAGTRICASTFYKNIDQHSPCILNVLDALGGLYEGGPLAGRAFQANTIAVSKDPVTIDAFLLNVINHSRKLNKYPILTIQDGRAEDRHPNASFLRIAADTHQLGNLSLEREKRFDLSGLKPNNMIVSKEKAQSRIGNVSPMGNGFNLDIFLDNSGKKHQIESYIQDASGKVIRDLSTQTTQTSHAILHWDFKDNSKKGLGKGLYSWNIIADGMIHTRTVDTL